MVTGSWDPEFDDEGSDDPTSPIDPDALVLDESFVADATFHEPSAAERTGEAGPHPSGSDPTIPHPAGITSFEPTQVFITTSGSRPSTFDGPYGGRAGTFDADDFPPLDDELDQILEERSRRRRQRRRRTVRTLAVVVLLAVVGVYGLDHFATGLELLPWTRVNRALSGNEPPDGATPARPDDQTGTDPDAAPDDRVKVIRGDDWPPAPENPSAERVLPAVVATTTGSHDFIMFQDDDVTPVAYDPCRPIRYVVSGAANAPIEGKALLDEAIAEVSKVTGLAFVDEGASTERPSDTRRAYQPDLYGEVWAPVLIAWSDPVESPRLAEDVNGGDPSTQMDVLGYAGSNAVGFRTVEGDDDKSGDTSFDGSNSSDGMIFITGGVTLDGPDFASLLQTPDGYEIARSAIMHELAHLVGLAHIDDRTQLMFPALQPGVTSFAGGDLEGLATLGAGVCMPEI